MKAGGPRYFVVACVGPLLAFSLACDTISTVGSVPSYPEAMAYEHEPIFIGVWVGDVDTLPGTLQVGWLDGGQYYGSFKSDDGSTEYVLLMEHSLVRNTAGGEVPSNRCTFDWQDGRGSRGQGWLLINREDTALTGSFGYGSAVTGVGDWTFVRLE